LPVNLEPETGRHGVGAWVRRVLGAGGPRLRLRGPAEVALGQRFEIAWTMEGRAARELAGIAFMLTGNEIARQRISARTGISIVSETAAFARVEMSAAEGSDIGSSVHVDAAGLAHGRVFATVPSRAVPSLPGRTNEIAWAVMVEAIFQSRSPLRLSFPITVVARRS
jgi:hypothetical protein